MLQDQIQLDFLLKQLCWDRMVANDFLVTLDSIQLCSGFIDPILDLVETNINYLNLAEMGAYLWIEQAWKSHLQCDGDQSIMAQFCKIPGITRAKLCHANTVRLY